MLRAFRRFMTRRRGWLLTLVLPVIFFAAAAAAPCSSDASNVWTVSDTASATALAAEVNCSGGVFNVEWTGSVVVEHEIYVAGGTVLNVAGSDGEAEMKGSGDNRLFTVDNAFLNVSGMIISNGNATFGGAIACDGSRMSFFETSFVDNVAVEGNGGALHIISTSSVSWDGSTTFVGNNANLGGGAVFVGDASSVSWTGDTSLSSNTAHQGGAMYVDGNSSVSWEAETLFDDNTAVFTGGALNVYNGSRVSWTATTTFTNNNGQWGGGIHVENNSRVSWEAETLFLGNHAPNGGGGGLDIYDGSTASWGAATRFISNNATIIGGAVHVNSASVSWDSRTTFTENIAGEHAGGAIYLFDGSTVSWTGDTSFSNNRAVFGGALASDGSRASWEAETSFIGNAASVSGGALNAFRGSALSWMGKAYFFNNTASSRGGGGVYALNRSSVLSEAETEFAGNSAGQAGGAVLIEYGSSVSLKANTSFVNNYAGASGGAVSVSSSNENSEDIMSSIFIDNSTKFLENSCKEGGGAMAIIGEISASFAPGTLTFSRNSAAFAGGAVFVAGSEIGPQFSGATFTSNRAGKGGAASLTGSGTAVTNYKFLNVTVFDNCRFSGNEATIDGGAVETGAGHENFTNTLFIGNTAHVGGALSLSGTASISNCTFVENTSAEDEGPAISNVGSILTIENTSFADNAFACDAGKYLGYEMSGNWSGTVCNGCGALCTDCHLHPRGITTPVCHDEPEHAKSAGGKRTVQMLSIDRGYWRATSTTDDVRACYNPDACLGGITGSANFCEDGYRGPYCSICKANFTTGPGYTCHSCSERTGGVVLVIVLGVLAFGALVGFVLYMVSAGSEGGGRRIVARAGRIIPLQSIKIIIVAWQILTQFSEVANVTYPDAYQEFLDGLDVLNFDLSWILSTGCIFDVDFHERLLISTIAPIVGLAILGGTYLLGGRNRDRWSDATLGRFRRKHLTMVIILTFLVYSSVSSILFQMFSCEPLADRKTYLRADYRIECDSTRHKLLQIYAGFMIVLYTVGIPVFYATLLFRHRDILTNEADREADSRGQPITSLWSPYQPQRYYYEVIECGRRIVLTGVVVFIYPNTSAQISVTLVLTVFFIFVSEALAPYASRWDSWVNRTGHAVIFLSMYVALLMKVDVSTEDPTSQRLFEVILVSVNAFMITVVLVEAIVIACALRYEELEAPKETSSRGVTSFFREEDGAWPGNVDDAETGANAVPRKFMKLVVPDRGVFK